MNTYHMVSQENLLAEIAEQKDLAISDLSEYTPGEIEALAGAALCLAREEHKARAVEAVLPPRAHTELERQVMLRVRLGVFLGQVADVLRSVKARKESEAQEAAAAF